MRDVSSRPPRRDWSNILAGRCQQLAGCTGDRCHAEVADAVESLVVDVPADLTMAERLVTRSRLTTVLARTMRLRGIDRRDDVLAIFFDWAASEITSPTWHGDVDRFVAGCATALRGNADARSAPPAHARIAASIGLIESNFSDPRLSLDRVAKHAGISVWYAARLLKRVSRAARMTAPGCITTEPGTITPNCSDLFPRTHSAWPPATSI